MQRYLSLAKVSSQGINIVKRISTSHRDGTFLFSKYEGVSPMELNTRVQFRSYSPIVVGNSGGESIWGRVKGMMGMRPKDVDLSQPFTIDEYAKQLSRANTMGNVAAYLPKSMRGQLPAGASEMAAKVYESQMKIVTAMTLEEKRDPTKIDLVGRTRIAQAAGCAPEAVAECVNKFEYMRGTVKKMQEMKRKGKQLPKSFEEMNSLMGGYKPSGSVPPSTSAGAPSSGGEKKGPRVHDAAGRTTAGMSIITSTSGPPGRNAPCPCGSGKRYKRCCWEKDHSIKKEN
mmetsp:Transcript_10205/g.13925  ORF Transcript_10205/g.13925 Transcript_10205/m.13925 type:complete len:286 (+) Transcript_10205:133-990(+)